MEQVRTSLVYRVFKVVCGVGDVWGWASQSGDQEVRSETLGRAGVPVGRLSCLGENKVWETQHRGINKLFPFERRSPPCQNDHI